MFTGELLDYQIDSANKLCQRKKEILALPQGLGKTVIAIASAEKLFELGYAQSCVVVCPTGIGWQWVEKIKEFTNHEDVKLVEAKRKSSRIYRANESLYTIVPYSVFRKDYEKLLEVPYDLVIADEAQEFSSFRSKTFKLIRRLQPVYRWALTGTAISNKLEELYAIMQWVDRYFLPHWKRFEELHLVRNPHTKQIIKYKNIETLNKYLLSKRLDRKTVDELKGKLPEVITHRIYIEKDKEVEVNERSLYSILASSNLRSTSLYSTSFNPEISKALHQTRESLSNSTKLDYAAELLKRILDESINNRVVVYSFYKQPLYDLHERFTCSALFTGDQLPDEKREAVEALRSGEARVLLTSNAGKAGLDLPFANYTIHLDVPFSYGTLDQRSTRTRRVSSEHSSVVVIYLLVKDSIDEFYFNVLGKKADLAKAALEGGKNDIIMRDLSLKLYLAQFYGSNPIPSTSY